MQVNARRTASGRTVQPVSLGLLVAVFVASLCLVLITSSDRGFGIALGDAAINDLGYLERPASIIEKNDRVYGWAVAIEREEIDAVRVNFEMSALERQTLNGLGRPSSVSRGDAPMPAAAMDELLTLVAQARSDNGADAATMPVVRLVFGDGSVLFSSPRVLMRHCPEVDNVADVYRLDGVYLVLESC